MLAYDTLEHEIRGAIRRVEVIKPCVRKVFCNVLETSRGSSTFDCLPEIPDQDRVR